VLIWHSPTSERWGAFAGGFEEVDENIWYEEREDEFDFVSVFISGSVCGVLTES
jgi:COMPASS component SWD1